MLADRMDFFRFLVCFVFVSTLCALPPPVSANPVLSVVTGVVANIITDSINSICPTILSATSAAKKNFLDSMNIGGRWVSQFKPTLSKVGTDSLNQNQVDLLNKMDTVLTQATSSYKDACSLTGSTTEMQSAANEANQFASYASQVANTFGFRVPSKRALPTVLLDVPCDWMCSPSEYADGKACHCDCGTLDPDCVDENLPIYGCPNDATPSCPAGVCLSKTNSTVPSEWKCFTQFYDAGDGCDCNCGAWDPDCEDPTQSVFGCLPTQTCAEATARCADSAVPNSWICSLRAYNSSDGCDCNCGAPDPDCLINDGLKAGSCPCRYMECSSQGFCVGECSGYSVSEGPAEKKSRSKNDHTFRRLLENHQAQMVRYQSQVQRTTLTPAQEIAEQKRTLFSLGKRADICPVPSGWFCPAAYYNAQDGCDCDCGEWDPDCDQEDQFFVFGCQPAFKSLCLNSNSLGGVCSTIATVPAAGWICHNQYYNDSHYCDCGCGAWDPDCDNNQLAVYGCAEGIKCQRSSATCDYRSVPDEWSCNPAFYLDDDCDCNCGASDPACEEPQTTSVLGCPCPDMSCSNGFCVGECGSVNIEIRALHSSSVVRRLFDSNFLLLLFFLALLLLSVD